MTQADTNGEAYSILTEIRRDPARGRVTCTRPRWALVLGGADCVWQDVLTVERELTGPWEGLVIAANDIGAHWPRALDHWVTLHPDHFNEWTLLRAQHGFAPGYATWSRWYRPDIAVDYRVCPWGGGSSGFFAMQVALELGCTHVVLCGIPMTRTPHFAETTMTFHKIWLAANAHWKAWEDHRDKLGDRVKSLSGRTRALLGAPTREWLAGVPTAGYAPEGEANPGVVPA